MPGSLVVSPELALIDPELACAARLVLPEPGAPFWRPPDHAPEVDGGLAAVSRIAVPRPRVASRRRSLATLGAPVVGTLVVAVLGVTVAAEAVRTPADAQRGTDGAERTLSVETSSGARPEISHTRVRRKQPAINSSEAGKPRSSTGEVREQQRKRSGSSIEPRLRHRRAPDAATHGVAEPRALPPLAWPPVKGARYYRVELDRVGRTIFRARTASARLRIPGRWKRGGKRYGLFPGRYRWRVVAYPRRPQARGRLTRRLVVDAYLFVPRTLPRARG